ncbi:MAG: hypothetical protein HY556_03580 [Euryarchaeota archaeon]|nr:hypothetical protein [Euryarchaeota archaeon]
MADELFFFWAFVAGALSFFSPCCIAMLPAYVSYYLSADTGQSKPAASNLGVAAFVAGAILFALGIASSFQVLTGESELGVLQVALLGVGAVTLALGLRGLDPQGLRRSIAFAGANVLGILTIFTLIGIPLVFLTTGLLTLTNIGLAVQAVGVTLILAGVVSLAGRFPSFMASVGAPRGKTPKSFYVFGLGYGVVALGCNLPLLLVPLGSAIASGGALTGVATFVSYGLGMGALMLATTVSLSFGKGITRERIRALQPFLSKVTGVVLIVVGTYIVYYWQTVLAGP